MATLKENTVVVHPETGEPTLLAATGEVPDWATDLVGDHLIEGGADRPKRNDDEVARLKARIAELEAEKAGGASTDDTGNDGDKGSEAKDASTTTRRPSPVAGKAAQK